MNQKIRPFWNPLVNPNIDLMTYSIEKESITFALMPKLISMYEKRTRTIAQKI